MHFSLKFVQKIFSIKNYLTRIGKKEPLSKVSLVIIIALDFFVLTTLFTGLAQQTSDLNKPNDYIPPVCLSVIIDQEWNSENIADKLQKIVVNYNNRRSYTYEDTKKVHSSCKTISKRINIIKKDKDLSSSFIKRKKLLQEIKVIDRNFGKYKGVYDSSKISGIKVTNLDNLVGDKAQTLDKLLSNFNSLEKNILSNSIVKSFKHSLTSFSSKQREDLLEDLRYERFWFPVKVLLIQLLFLLPPLLVVLFWNSRSIKKEKDIQVLMSSHLLLVICIPIAVRFFDIILNILPKKFLKDFWHLLEDLHLTALWHYLSIILFVFIAMLLVYVVQKKIFNKDRLMAKRFGKGICFNCGFLLGDRLAKHCPHCGVGNMVKCKKCNQETYKYSLHCHLCGAKKELEE